MPPHANWAQYYDFVYENGHGQLYQDLTERTLTAIQELRTPPCSVVDFGAGTGRLAVPLAARGYAVTAVEPCQEMMDVLIAKAGLADVQIESRVQSLQDFNGGGRFDIALCVFTTVLYLLDEASLRKGLTNFVHSLRPGGKLLIDIPTHAVFQSYHIRNTVLDRKVTVTQIGSTYQYQENTRCLIDGVWQEYEDCFNIRNWQEQEVLSIIKDCGVDYEGPIPGFEGTGSNYYEGTRIR